MPELPEVAEAVRRLDLALRRRSIAKLTLLHPSLQRSMSDRVRRALRGAGIERTERRGKHQLIHLGDGRVLHAHFRMTGDWATGARGEEPPRQTRAVLELDDGSWVALVDPRALATLVVHRAGEAPDLGLGPEPSDAALDAAYLAKALAARRGAIKPALLDQGIIAGLGNIYAAESLWHSRLDPRREARGLSRPELQRLLKSIRAVIARATGARYRNATASRLDVYDRAGEPCRRCGTVIERIVQAGRSTYFCPSCQG